VDVSNKETGTGRQVIDRVNNYSTYRADAGGSRQCDIANRRRRGHPMVELARNQAIQEQVSDLTILLIPRPSPPVSRLYSTSISRT
jgi:hypothetical protein